MVGAKGIILFNLLTVLTFSFYSLEAFSSLLLRSQQKNHLRWKLAVPKGRLSIKKEGDKVSIKTLSKDIFQSLKAEAQKIQTDAKYIKGVTFDEKFQKTGAFGTYLQLKDENVEVFTFYKDRDKKYVIDFWKEGDNVAAVSSAIRKDKGQDKIEKTDKERDRILDRSTITASTLKATAPKKEKTKQRKVLSVPKSDYRDFRYGVPFYWDYEALPLEFSNIINLKSKTPEHFYPIKDRDYKKSEEEAHLQLSINMFRKKKWGLMYKSIKIYKEKYGEKSNYEMNEYLKANAILRDNFNKDNHGPKKMALGILKTLEGKSRNYPLRKGILKYFLQYFLEKKEYVGFLKTAKKLYVLCKENFDYEEMVDAAEAILFSLTNLNQVSKIEEILQQSDMAKSLSPSKMLGYKIYANMKLGKTKKVINIYETNEKKLADPIHEAVIFNVAEAYFREANFQKALKLFDEFIKRYSFHQYASKARVRLALIYELTHKNPKHAEVLYRNAINRTRSFHEGVEARIRYVALRNTRKRKISKEDKEIRIFLKLNKRGQTKMNGNLKKILWLTRLRLFIVDGKYDNALKYLKLLPLHSLKLSEQRVFDADGAEIVYGMMTTYYRNGEYPKIVKLWDTYKEKYILKSANDPRVNFIVGKAYLKLGLYEGFENIYKDFGNISDHMSKTFPIWLEQESNLGFDLVYELSIVKQLRINNLELAQKKLNRFKKDRPDDSKQYYYQGIIFYRNKKYREAVKSFEFFLSSSKRNNLFDPEEVGEMIMAYSDSLYKLGEFDKVKRAATAMLDDTKKYASDKGLIKVARERLSYLRIEILSAEKDKSAYQGLGDEILRFNKEYPNSVYKGRVNYLLGFFYISTQKVEDGKKIFNKLLDSKNVSTNVKGLVRSELAMLTIKEKEL